MTLLLDVKLALSQSVPKLDRLVPRSGDDLPVVSRERDGQDVGGVTDESSSGRAGVQVPESEGVVPRRGEGELTCRWGRVQRGFVSFQNDEDLESEGGERKKTHRRTR